MSESDTDRDSDLSVAVKARGVMPFFDIFPMASRAILRCRHRLVGFLPNPSFVLVVIRTLYEKKDKICGSVKRNM